jgi:hypothetical protein
MAQGEKPRITWGTSFGNTLNIGYPLDRAIAYPLPRGGSEFIQSRSGVEEAWIVGDDYYLSGSIRWIPTSTTTNPVATGWDGATGFEAFLVWARKRNIFRWIPNYAVPGTYKTCYLVEPWGDPPSQEDDGTRTINIVMRSSDQTAFTGY